MESLIFAAVVIAAAALIIFAATAQGGTDEPSDGEDKSDRRNR